jgi:hypothetical protein
MLKLILDKVVAPVVNEVITEAVIIQVKKTLRKVYVKQLKIYSIISLLIGIQFCVLQYPTSTFSFYLIVIINLGIQAYFIYQSILFIKLLTSFYNEESSQLNKCKTLDTVLLCYGVYKYKSVSVLYNKLRETEVYGIGLAKVFPSQEKVIKLIVAHCKTNALIVVVLLTMYAALSNFYFKPLIYHALGYENVFQLYSSLF